MEIVRGSKNYLADKPLAIAIGNFDGVHSGHTHLLEMARHEAEQKNAVPAVYTFDPHPVRIVAPFGAPPLIQTLDQRLDLIAKHGIEVAIVEEFTHKLAGLEPEEYFNSVLYPLNLSSIIIGYDFTFGRERSGDSKKLTALGKSACIDIKIAEPQFFEGTLISSTIIRQLIAAGEIEHANMLLGHPYCTTGIIESGEGRGKKLGFPTLNLKANNELLPGPGVYITTTTVGDKEQLPAVTCTGPAATFGRRDFTIETFVLDRELESHSEGKESTVTFLKRLRPMISFPDEHALVKKMNDDVQKARKYHSSGS